MVLRNTLYWRQASSLDVTLACFGSLHLRGRGAGDRDLAQEAQGLACG